MERRATEKPAAQPAMQPGGLLLLVSVLLDRFVIFVELVALLMVCRPPF